MTPHIDGVALIILAIALLAGLAGHAVHRHTATAAGPPPRGTSSVRSAPPPR
ncbi:hypothetical protein [Streptomyces sp. NPDC089795]|uniref:hypothetical protein n=1 Tax=Streptomyces sp. NPDC089795 TaxID=3155297 RepID=UPI00341E1B9A